MNSFHILWTNKYSVSVYICFGLRVSLGLFIDSLHKEPNEGHLQVYILNTFTLFRKRYFVKKISLIYSEEIDLSYK